jgi:hypothetical protein
MSRNVYFTQGTGNEQNLIEDLIIESLSIYGQSVYYIPRKYVNKDQILGEDTLSKFEHAYPIEMYFDNIDSYDGQGAFIQKFGLMLEQSATLTVARRKWNQLVGQYGNTILTSRPVEGDLIYFPLTKSLFEIKFVKHQDPFYQLGKLYVYKLQVELFQYASERLDTGIPEIDTFETLKTFDINPTRNEVMYVDSLTITNIGARYITAPTITFSGGNPLTNATAVCTIENGKINSATITNVGSGFRSVPIVTISSAPAGGVTATATCTINMNVDRQGGYGDNVSARVERNTSGNKVAWSEDNPFGEF